MGRGERPEFPAQLKKLIEDGRKFSPGATLFGVDLLDFSQAELSHLLAITLAGIEVRARESAEELERGYLKGNGNGR